MWLSHRVGPWDWVQLRLRALCGRDSLVKFTTLVKGRQLGKAANQIFANEDLRNRAHASASAQGFDFVVLSIEVNFVKVDAFLSQKILGTYAVWAVAPGIDRHKTHGFPPKQLASALNCS